MESDEDSNYYCPSLLGSSVGPKLPAPTISCSYPNCLPKTLGDFFIPFCLKVYSFLNFSKMLFPI